MNDIFAVHGKRRTVHEYDGASGRSPCGHVQPNRDSYQLMPRWQVEPSARFCRTWVCEHARKSGCA